MRHKPVSIRRAAWSRPLARLTAATLATCAATVPANADTQPLPEKPNIVLSGKWHVGMTFFDSDGKAILDNSLEAVKRIDYSRPVPGGPIHRGLDRFSGTVCCPTSDWLYAYMERGWAGSGKPSAQGNTRRHRRHSPRCRESRPVERLRYKRSRGIAQIS